MQFPHFLSESPESRDLPQIEHIGLEGDFRSVEHL